MRRTKEDAAITRQRLLDAALLCFHARGYAATTLDDIAQEAGITRGAIQWHFGNKVELFNALIRECYMKAAEKFKELYTQGGTPLEVLHKVMSRWISYPEEDVEFRTMLELVILKTEVSPEMAEGIQEKNQSNRQSMEYFAYLIKQGIASGEIRSDIRPEVAATAILGLTGGITNLWLMDPSAFSLKNYAEETTDIFLRGISQI